MRAFCKVRPVFPERFVRISAQLSSGFLFLFVATNALGLAEITILEPLGLPVIRCVSFDRLMALVYVGVSSVEVMFIMKLVVGS